MGYVIAALVCHRKSALAQPFEQKIGQKNENFGHSSVGTNSMKTLGYAVTNADPYKLLPQINVHLTNEHKKDTDIAMNSNRMLSKIDLDIAKGIVHKTPPKQYSQVHFNCADILCEKNDQKCDAILLSANMRRKLSKQDSKRMPRSPQYDGWEYGPNFQSEYLTVNRGYEGPPPIYQSSIPNGILVNPSNILLSDASRRPQFHAVPIGAPYYPYYFPNHHFQY